jgi:hypothetical protein
MNMREKLEDMLGEDGHKNSLGRVNDVIDRVLSDSSRVEELYNAMFNNDAWVRMRAADAFEKICREHPEWIQPYVDRIQSDLSKSEQPSIQWHIAEIYCQVELDERQKAHAIEWLKKLLSSVEVDWIVAANSMKALAYFGAKGDISKSDLKSSLKIQLGHKSNAVVKRAKKLLEEFAT